MTQPAVHDALARVWRSRGALFATFECEDDEGLFVQYVDGVLHLSLPGEQSLAEALEDAGVELPRTAFVMAGAAGAPTGQIAVGDLTADAVARLVHALFERLLVPGWPEHAIVTRVEPM